ncbi:MAG: Type 1 glutamine amidotransferase-like domain-containing protein [Xanthomonadales bacterium]|jgi:hypothetical protein|nr:Type 1 glutamine amidotransferase-like domain-containing protein [Xanthomonadales bacterium]
MTADAPRRLLLGPQRPAPYLREALEAAEIEARSFAVISAGWQEAESDIDIIRDAVGRPVADLELYRRAETLFAEVPKMGEAYRERQARLKEQQRLYRSRLKQLAIAARNVTRENAHPALVDAELRHAITQLRALDRHHLRATERLHAAVGPEWQHARNRPWRRHHDEIAARIEAHDAVIVTGGNLPVLLNRLRLFGLADLLADRTVIGWSAGAMALAHHVVLYHDHMPHGRREPEVLGAGCGLIQRFVVLPDPVHRLRRNRPGRLGLLARRMSPQRCLTLDHGEYACFAGEQLVAAHKARHIDRKGRHVRLRPS